MIVWCSLLFQIVDISAFVFLKSNTNVTVMLLVMAFNINFSGV